MDRLIRYPDETLVLPPQLCGSIGYYRLLASYGHVVIADGMRYDKRYKSVHRYEIADARGVQRLTVPVSRPSGATQWNEIKVSDHGQWWSQHLRTLETVYSAGPFFEFYIDRFRPMFEADAVTRYGGITGLAGAMDAEIRGALHLSTVVEHSDDPGLRPTLLRFDEGEDVMYYQHIATERRLGLSVLDLIFNMGPEGVLGFRCGGVSPTRMLRKV